MPITPAHAIVALPFVRTPIVPAAVAIGAMTPDLPLFVWGTPVTYALTHDLLWLPLTMLLAFAFLVLWRCVLRPASRELSPRWLAERLPTGWDVGAAASLRETLRPGRAGLGILYLVVALALGVVSHVVWDSFTHEGRAGTRLIPALAEDWGPFPGFRWLQHGSSVVGVAVLATAAVVWLRGRTPAPAARALPGGVRVAWWLSLPALLAVGTVVGYLVLGPFDADFTPAHLAYQALPPLVAAWGIATVALCVVVQLRRRPSAGTRSHRHARQPA